MIDELKKSIKLLDAFLYGAIFLFLSLNYYFKFTENIETIGLIITVISLIYSIIDNRLEASEKEKYEKEKLLFEKKIKNKELMAEFFMEIFFKDISREIPNKVLMINMVESYDEKKRNLIELLKKTQEIEDKSVFYKYVDENNYNMMKKSIQDMQDHISKMINNDKETYSRRKVDLEIEFEKKISLFYKTLIDYYSPF